MARQINVHPAGERLERWAAVPVRTSSEIQFYQILMINVTLTANIENFSALNVNARGVTILPDDKIQESLARWPLNPAPLLN